MVFRARLYFCFYPVGELTFTEFVMKEIRLDSWADYLEKIKEIRSPDSFFRGQSRATWPLETTLERKVKGDYRFRKYLIEVSRIAPKLESFSGNRWDLPAYKDLENNISEIECEDPFWVHLPMYPFLVYLRHYGFPSPLLDWTESPFIAAYFAYMGADDADPAVFIFTKRDDRTQINNEPIISFQDKYIRTDKRHFSQKTRYTIATRNDNEQNTMFFCEHLHALCHAGELCKLILPVKERKSALSYLNDHNINHFTLFHSEDSLIKSMAVEVFDLQ